MDVQSCYGKDIKTDLGLTEYMAYDCYLLFCFSAVRLMAHHVQMTVYQWKLLILVAVLRLMVVEIDLSKVPNQVNNAVSPRNPRKQRPYGWHLKEGSTWHKR